MYIIYTYNKHKKYNKDIISYNQTIEFYSKDIFIESKKYKWEDILSVEQDGYQDTLILKLFRNKELQSFPEIFHLTFKYEYDKRRPGDAEKLIANVDKLHQHINWKPKFDDLKLIIKTAVEWEKKIDEKNL